MSISIICFLMIGSIFYFQENVIAFNNNNNEQEVYDIVKEFHVANDLSEEGIKNYLESSEIVDEIVEELKAIDKNGELFGGVYFDNDGKLNIGIVKNHSSINTFTEKAKDLIPSGKEEYIKFFDVKYSKQELVDISEKLFNYPEILKEEGVHLQGGYVSRRYNRYFIEVKNTNEDVKETIKSVFMDHPAIVIQLGVETSDDSRLSAYDPIIGGVVINRTGMSARSSVGFAAVDNNGRYGWVTHAHGENSFFNQLGSYVQQGNSVNAGIITRQSPNIDASFVQSETTDK
ncbi:hypothetical protein QA612_07930 [Evansella sp. AB-P1]|uniref:hypothetical protein n=1 Tax=Evansella sp. AB-P1 TaxID=3037653 RepID=UPI00241E649C|nr:hypothetical protein [Evansella sp. AB-P1]MDG5787421.1 hypothetical protein [Evansella sp. AB-P1]